MDAKKDWNRPVRGAVQVRDVTVDLEKLRDEVSNFQGMQRKTLDAGNNWSDIFLVRDGDEHEILESCPEIRSLLDRFEGKVFAITLADLGPGGWVKEHRDISGGSMFGVCRLHIPIFTNDKVEFCVDGETLHLAAGEVWYLDTTYRHSVRNDSDAVRTHMILDLKKSEYTKAMLPPVELADFAHNFLFFFIGVSKILALVLKPRTLIRRLEKLVRLVIFKKSSLEDSNY